MLASRRDFCFKVGVVPCSYKCTWHLGSHRQFEASPDYIVNIDGSLRHEKDQSLPPNTLPTKPAMVAHTPGEEAH